MRRAHAIVVALGIGCVGPSRAVAAEPTVSAQAAARDAFAAGERSFERGAYPDAMASFAKAFQLVSHDAVRFNIAVCLERMQRYREAWVQYRAAAESTMLGPADRSRAEDAAERVRRELGALVVSGKAGDPVAVDGEVRCSVPCRVELDPRVYRLTVGSAPARTVRIERGGEVHLEAAEGEPPAPAHLVPTPAPMRRARGPGWLTWTGGALTAIGVGCAIGFGLRTQSLHASYVDAPSESTRDRGIFARTVTNVAIGVAIVGVALVAVDLLVLAPRDRTGAP